MSGIHTGERATVHRAVLPCEFAALGEDGGRLRVRGVLNSFGAMHSHRILHPKGYQNWLKRNGGRPLPMLAQHGEVRGGFATIGEWDKLAYDPNRGAVWEGWIGQGTNLQAEARSLVGQKLLKQLSWGWLGEPRLVRLGDADLDPHYKRIMQDRGMDTALGFGEYDVVEGSLVDVADDPAARLAAKLLDSGSADEFHERLKELLGQGGGEADGELRAEVARLRREVDAIRAAGSPAASETLQALGEAFRAWRQDFIDGCVSALDDPELRQAAADRAELDDDLEDLADDEPETGDTDTGDGSDFARLRALLRETAAGR